MKSCLLIASLLIPSIAFAAQSPNVIVILSDDK